jgi:hypothetical protein
LYEAGGGDGPARVVDVVKSLEQRGLRGVHAAHDGLQAEAGLADFVALRAQAHAHQFHYETGTRLLYWFGTQPILARRSPVHPLAKLLILSLFSEKIAHALAVILHGDWCTHAHTM